MVELHDDTMRIEGPRTVINMNDERFPNALRTIPKPPKRLYVIGNPAALEEGLAVVGARRATPYGLGCARRFASLAAERGIVIISGGARGCDAASHRAVLEVGERTVAFLGGGCDRLYPVENATLFQEIVNGGGALVSEMEWDCPPLPWMFRERNRLIAGLSKATLIVEAGLPSGTFSTADEALAANRDVLVVPGAITSHQSRGANRLICQGAHPIVDDETFLDELFMLFGCLREQTQESKQEEKSRGRWRVVEEALQAQCMDLDSLLALMEHEREGADLPALMMWLSQAVGKGSIAQYPDGRYGPAL